MDLNKQSVQKRLVREHLENIKFSQSDRVASSPELEYNIETALKKNNAVNENQINETSDNIEPLAKAAS